MKYKVSICALLLTSLSAASAQVAAHSQPAGFTAPTTQISRPAGRPVARVNGVVLTDVDLVREEYAIFPYAKQHGGKIPADMEPGIRKGALDMIIFEELVYQDAQKRNVTISAERINTAMAEFRKQFDSTGTAIEERSRRKVLRECCGAPGFLRQKPAEVRISGILRHPDHFHHSA
jgi:hypothetical protein